MRSDNTQDNPEEQNTRYYSDTAVPRAWAAIFFAISAALHVGMITRRCGSYCEMMFSSFQREAHRGRTL